MARVETACRDCKKCMNSGIANLGRNSGRIFAGMTTLGISEMGMKTRKTCRLCGHQLSLHMGDNIGAKPSTVVVSAPVTVAPPPTSGPPPGRYADPHKHDLRQDIATAAEAMKGLKLGSNREIRKLEEHLSEGETVRRIAAGYFANAQGLLALTDRRLFFLKDSVLSKASADFPFDQMVSVAWRSGLVQGAVVILANGAEAKIERVYKDDGKALVDEACDAINVATTPVTGFTPPPVPVDDIPAQIAKLAQLRDAGVLTDAEFDAKKAEMLARM